MKIVRIIARLNVGGPARHVVWLTRALNEGQYTSALVAGTVPGGEEDMSWFAAENGVAPVYIEEMSRELSPKDIVSLWKVYRMLVREQPDIVHTHTAKAGTVGRIAAFFYRLTNRKKVKIIHTFHGHIFHSYYGNLKTKVFLSIEKTLAKFATDKIIVISDQQFDEIHNRFHVGEKEQFKVVPLGIDLEKFADSAAKRNLLREEIGAKPDEILVGFVGRLTEIKNIPRLLETARIYQENQDAGLPKIVFLIIGDGNLRDELKAQAVALGLGETVRFLGNRNDADVFYAGLDIVALTSLNEGTPLSLIEAMAAGTPVISTAVGGVRDLLGAVERSENGFTICERGVKIELNSSEDFYRGLIYLAKDEKLRKNLSLRGGDFVRSKYGKARLIADIKSLYDELDQSMTE